MAALTDAILETVGGERTRQDAHVREGRFAWTCADPLVAGSLKLAVLIEEVGEVGRALLGNSGAVSDGGDLRTELTQVAAGAVAWLESLEQETIL